VGERKRLRNIQLRVARSRMLSPSGSGRPMSRQELADAVNAYLWTTYQIEDRVDATDVGKYERGENRWPGAKRREAFRAVLHVRSDAELGFYIIRGPSRTFSDQPEDAGSPGTSRITVAPTHAAEAGTAPHHHIPEQVVCELLSLAAGRQETAGLDDVAALMGRVSLGPTPKQGSRAGEDLSTYRRDVARLAAMLLASAAAESILGVRTALPGARPSRPVNRAALTSLTQGSGAQWASPLRRAVLDPLAVVRSDSDGAEATPGDLPRLRRSVALATQASLSARHLYLAARLPKLVGQAECLNLAPQRDGGGGAMALLSDTYALGAWVLIKADDPTAAWIAAQRAVTAAENAGDVLRLAAATRCLSEVYMRAGLFGDACRTALLANAHLDRVRPNRPAAVCIRGAALLSAAAAAARDGNEQEARAALTAAAVHGDNLGQDRVDLGTMFGPTNVAIHRVATAVELGDIKSAAAHLPTVKLATMPAHLTERRARFLIDAARVHCHRRNDAAAVAALTQAESLAPQETRTHRLTRAVLIDLLARERRSSDVRALAARCGVGR
jgi:hypothetical protein